jgi:hypothetical protein
VTRDYGSDSGTGMDGGQLEDAQPELDSLMEELRRAAAVLDPLPASLRQIAVEAYALHDLDAKTAELTFDSLVDAAPVRGAAGTAPPRMLTFEADGISVDVELTGEGLLGQVLPPGPADVEVLTPPHVAVSAVPPLTADDMGRFEGGPVPRGLFALRLRTGGDVVMTEWLRA